MNVDGNIINKFTYNDEDIKKLEYPEDWHYAMHGWLCPKCGRSLSPWTSECPCNYLNNVTCNTRRIVYDPNFPLINTCIEYTYHDGITTAHNY